MQTKILVNTKFDGGSIEIIDINNPANLRFKIRKDTNSHFAQWFYFQITNVKDMELNLFIDKLEFTAYPDGWKNYNVCISYDNKYWIRLDSCYENNTLNFKLKSKSNSVYFAYFEPYSYQRHLELIGKANISSLVKHEVIGHTLEGRNIDCLVVGNINSQNKIWIIARQHPGETMAEWFMEGLSSKLIDKNDSVAKNLLQNSVFYLVPNMNPDGSYHGNLRVNVAGTNLNREWSSPSLDKSPEVLFVRQKMLETGVDMFFDIHGDEGLPYVFTAGCEDNPSFSKHQEKLATLFQHYFELVNPDYQTKIGYDADHFNRERELIATNWVGDKFNCLAFTIEMPFKDNNNLPDTIHGWNGCRSSALGESLLVAINSTLNANLNLNY